jgi:hypothetical protein
LIGRAVLLTSSLCSASSLGTPGISDGLHAKMSVLSLTKLVSASSYLELRSAPMMTSLDASGRPRQTFLAARLGSKAVLVRFCFGTYKVVSSILADWATMTVVAAFIAESLESSIVALSQL